MKQEITARQKEILGFIAEFGQENGYPPSLRDIASHFGISSTNGVAGHLEALVTKNFLSKESNSSRTLTITEKGWSVLGLEGQTAEKEDENPYSLPLLGRVAAGFPIMHYDNIEGSVVVDPSMLRERKDSFALKVKGDSMINAGIFEGDIVVVHKQIFASNGDIVVAQIDGEVTVKTYLRKNNQIILLPANEKYDPIVISQNSNFILIGKVTGVTRCLN
ncbi:MAG: LexA repressor [Ignavibacteriales bacterium]|jgi:repressor LexA